MTSEQEVRGRPNAPSDELDAAIVGVIVGLLSGVIAAVAISWAVRRG